MNSFNKRTAVRIAFVSALLAAVASLAAWFISHYNAEKAAVALAMEESGHILHHFCATALSAPDAATRAGKAAEILAGGLFDSRTPSCASQTNSTPTNSRSCIRM